MRLRDILVLVNESLPIIKNISISPNSSYTSYKIFNIKKVYIYFRRLSEVEALKKDIELLLSRHPYLITEQEFTYIDSDAYNDFTKILEEIKSKCNIISKIITQIIRPQNEYTISFKLYSFDNFSEFTDFCDDLNKKILVPLKRLKIDIQLGELETGSDWLSIICGTGLGVMLLAAIVRQAFDILIYDYEKFRVAKSIANSLEMENAFMEDFNKKALEHMEKIKCEKVDQIIGEIKEDDNFPSLDVGELSELRTSINLSMDLMGKHIDKGLEVYKALDIKENERYKLPDFTKLLAIKQPQKLITDNNENDASTEKESS